MFAGWGPNSWQGRELFCVVPIVCLGNINIQAQESALTCTKHRWLQLWETCKMQTSPRAPTQLGSCSLLSAVPDDSRSPHALSAAGTDIPARLQPLCWARNSQQHTTVHADLTPSLKFPDGSRSSFFLTYKFSSLMTRMYLVIFFSMHSKSFDNFHSPAAPVSMSRLLALNEKKYNEAYAPSSVPFCSHDAYLKNTMSFSFSLLVLEP